MSPLRDVALLARVLDDAPQRLYPDRATEWSAWPQTWSDGSCGFGGFAGQAITEAQTIIVSSGGATVAVYHDGRFAYVVAMPSGRFHELCRARNLPGTADSKRRLELEQPR